jgi:hypothetical protein
VGEVDLPHAAAAEFSFDLEWADGGGMHGRGVYGPNDGRYHFGQTNAIRAMLGLPAIE